MTPLSYIHNSVIPYTQLRFLTVISRPHMAYYIQRQLVNHKSVKNWILQYKCLNKNTHNTWVHMHVHYEYTWKVWNISKTHPTKVQNPYNYTI